VEFRAALEEMKSVDVRERLVDALRLDLAGPGNGVGDAAEVLPQAPSRWCLTGFLVPLEAESAQRADESSAEDLDQAGESGGGRQVAVGTAIADRPSHRSVRALPTHFVLVLVPLPGPGLSLYRFGHSGS
jgi:hypothetical protein